jgi:hypothetical protein
VAAGSCGPSNKRGWAALRLTTIGRKSGKERNVIIGYIEDGPQRRRAGDERLGRGPSLVVAQPRGALGRCRSMGTPASAPSARTPSAREERDRLTAVGRGRSEPRGLCRPAVDQDARDPSRGARRDRLTRGDEVAQVVTLSVSLVFARRPRTEPEPRGIGPLRVLLARVVRF